MGSTVHYWPSTAEHFVQQQVVHSVSSLTYRRKYLAVTSSNTFSLRAPLAVNSTWSFFFFFFASTFLEWEAQKVLAGWCSCWEKKNKKKKQQVVDWYTLSFSSSPFMFRQRVCLCQRRVCVSQPAMWWTWQLSGWLRWGQCSEDSKEEKDRKMLFF